MQGTSREIVSITSAPELGTESSLEYFYGDAGNDRLNGNGGDDFLIGGKGRDKLRGGAGSDILDAKDGQKDKQINCGPGKREKAYVDRIDPEPISC
jgi:Ca2+-binding RTX toxin-like protein